MSAPLYAVPAPVPAGPITGMQAEVLASALADAIEYRRDAAEGFCADCERHRESVCAAHSADLDRADDYLALAAEFGLEVDQ